MAVHRQLTQSENAPDYVQVSEKGFRLNLPLTKQVSNPAVRSSLNQDPVVFFRSESLRTAVAFAAVAVLAIALYFSGLFR